MVLVLGVFGMNEWVYFIHGGGGEINVLKKWSSNDSSGLGFLRHNAKISQDLCEIMGHNSPLQR